MVDLLGWVFLIAVFIGLIAAGIWLMRGATASEKTAVESHARLNERGVPAQATVVSKRERAFARGGSYYYMRYRFDVPGREPLTQESEINRPNFLTLKEGDSVAIRYLPDNPSEIRIEQSDFVDLTSPESIGRRATTARYFGTALFGLAVVGAAFALYVLTPHGSASPVALTLVNQVNATETKQAPATAAALQATIQADQIVVAKLAPLVAQKAVEWKKDKSQNNHTLLAPDTDLNAGETRIDYGYCPNGQFYAFVWMKVERVTGLDNTRSTNFTGYGYVEGSQPIICHPPGLIVLNAVNDGSSWYSLFDAFEPGLSTPSP